MSILGLESFILASKIETAKVNPSELSSNREQIAQSEGYSRSDIKSLSYEGYIIGEGTAELNAEQEVRKLRIKANDELYMKNLHPIDLQKLQEMNSFISEMTTKATEIKKSMKNLDPRNQEAIDLQLQLKQMEFAIEKGRNEQVLVCGTVYKDLDRRNTFAYDACLRYKTPFNFGEQSKSPTYNGTVKLETLNQTPTERSTIIRPVLIN